MFLDIELDSLEPEMDDVGMARQIRERELARQPVLIFVTGHFICVFYNIPMDWKI